MHRSIDAKEIRHFEHRLESEETNNNNNRNDNANHTSIRITNETCIQTRLFRLCAFRGSRRNKRKIIFTWSDVSCVTDRVRRYWCDARAEPARSRFGVSVSLIFFSSSASRMLDRLRARSPSHVCVHSSMCTRRRHDDDTNIR